MTDATVACALPPVLPLRDKPLDALRAIGANRGGLRIGAYPSVMPLLVNMGLIEKRAAPGVTGRRNGQAWFLTEAGRVVLAFYGRGDA